MIVHPARPRTRTVRPAVLHDETRARDEDGRLHPLDRLPATLRCFAAWETVDELARNGHGELICWGEEPIRWRHRKRGDSHRRKGDVVIVKLPVASRRQLAEGLSGWADWLDRHGVNAGWSLGGTSMRLLRATLERPLVTTAGSLPPERWTLGGRQQAWHEPGTSVCGALQLDLPAAYTTVLGGLRYGGAWRHVPEPPLAQLEMYEQARYPLLVRARVRLPGLHVGPLHRRPQRRPEAEIEQVAPTVPYPPEGSLQGLWTWQELAQAHEAGAQVRPLEAWVHCGADTPFAPWLDVVMEGRALPGFAGQLAKATGNALWGQFAIDDRKRLVVKRWNGAHTALEVQGSRGHQRRGWDIGELVTGMVRARLYDALRRFDRSELVCCHTDGLWIRDTPATAALVASLQDDGWRLKSDAAELQLVDQQKYRYRLRRGRSWRIVCSGIPSNRSAEVFEEIWRRHTAAAATP